MVRRTFLLAHRWPTSASAAPQHLIDDITLIMRQIDVPPNRRTKYRHRANKTIHLVSIKTFIPDLDQCQSTCVIDKPVFYSYLGITSKDRHHKIITGLGEPQVPRVLFKNTEYVERTYCIRVIIYRIVTRVSVKRIDIIPISTHEKVIASASIQRVITLPANQQIIARRSIDS